MLEIAVMVEGQNGLNWPRWQKITHTVEDLGFIGLYRSDHFTNSDPPDLDALELWVSLTWLASHTQRLELGPLVSPVSFRHPAHTARMAAAVDDLSGGRLTLGLGAGWQAREHDIFGWDLLEVPERFERFEEGLQVITLLLNSHQPVNFEGKYYRLHEAILLPRPHRAGHLPILIGGNGTQRTLPIAARFADEWNAVYLPPAEFSKRNTRLDELLQEQGRSPEQVRRSMMTGCIFGRTTAEVEKKANAIYSSPPARLREHGVLAGAPEEIRQQLDELERSGLQRVMLQWLDLDDMEGLQTLAHSLFT